MHGAVARVLLFSVFALALAAVFLTVHAQEPSPAATPPTPTPTPTQTPTPTPTTTPTPSPSPQEDEAVERIETNLTNVLLTAMDKERRFVTTLKQEDIRLLENGVVQQISVFQRETDLPLSLGIVVDTSRSQEFTLPDEKAAARAFIERVLRPATDNAALVYFTGKPFIAQPLTSDKASLYAAIERLKVEIPPDDPECQNNKTVEMDPRCWSSIWDANYATINQLLARTPERTRRAVILLSDGDDTSSITRKDELIEVAIKANTVIYAIGIGDTDNYSMDKNALRRVSERTGGRAFFPENRAELDAAFAQIEQELRAQYLIAYTPSDKNLDGSFRRIQIEIVNPTLRKQKLRLLYRQGYYAKAK